MKTIFDGTISHFALAIFVAVVAHTGCSAQAPSAKNGDFEARTFTRGDRTMPYRLYVPRNYDKSKKYPLILWLHGGGARGTDNQKQITEGNTLGATIWTQPENQAKNPAFVLVPQCPTGDWWANNDDEMRPSLQLEMAVALLNDLQKEYSIDADRLYVGGQSMGGYGTWSLIPEYPDIFAAALPICGGGRKDRAAKIKAAVWAFHGEKDEAVVPEESRAMIAALKTAGRSPKYTEYKGVGHNVWHQVFAEPGLVDWVFAQKRNK